MPGGRRNYWRRASRCVGFIALLSLTLGSCERAGPEPKSRMLPRMEFVGADLQYVLRRVAGEAGITLLLDEARPPGERDLSAIWIDVKLPATTLRNTLGILHHASGQRFNYVLDADLLHIRSTRAAESEAFRLTFPAVSIETDLPGLVSWIMKERPQSLLRIGERRGQPLFQKVQLDAPKDSTLSDLFTLYARAIQHDLHIQRGGYLYEDEQSNKIVAHTIGLWDALEDPRPLSEHRQRGSTIWALAQLAKRTGTTLCVLDRTQMQDGRGSLNSMRRLDRGAPLDEALEELSRRGRRAPRDFHWRELDGVLRVEARSYAASDGGRSPLTRTLPAGSVNGNLGDLARWINDSLDTQTLAVGEISAAFRGTRIEIPKGATVEETLLQFARTSGESWVGLWDTRAGDAPKIYLSRLEEWGPNGRPPLN